MRKLYALILLPLLLTGCKADEPASAEVATAPWVRTLTVTEHDSARISLSGTIKGRYETPIAFQVPGRILSRHVDAGQTVTAGQLLFQLDTRDLLANVRVAEAELATAEAALAIASSELKRQQQLVERDFVSRQTLERFELALREAGSRRDAARAVLAQARNGLGYADLKAERSGLLAHVDAEPGQVVAVGQPLALLVEEGALEVEVYLAEGMDPPKSGSLQLKTAHLPLVLREVAGAADPQSRSWRARYRIEQGFEQLSPGEVVQVVLLRDQQGSTLSIPLGALDERSGGPRVWQVVDGKAQPLPVEVLSLQREQAVIRADLVSGDRVIALGTHLLVPGMAVREQAR